MKSGLLFALDLLVCFAAIDKTEHISPVVFEELGVILQNQGVMSMNTDDLLVSVFVKANLPEWPLEEPCEKVICKLQKRCKYCAQQHVCTHNSSKEHWMAERFLRSTLEYVELFEDVSSTIVNVDTQQNSTRNKRFAGLLGIGLGLFNFAFNGISSYKLNSKVSQLQGQFDEFKHVTHDLKEDIIKLRDGTAHLFDAYSHNVNNKFVKLACSTSSRIKTLSHYQLLNEWERKLDRLFKYPLLGRITGPLTPELISTSHLKEIMESHSELSDLVYSENIANFYSACSITMAKTAVDNGSLNIHYVLHVPRISRSSTYPLYRVDKVQVRFNNSCSEAKLPKYVYHKGDSFFPVALENCELGEMFTSCKGLDGDLKDTEILCFSNPANCKFESVPCAAKHIFSPSGILVGSAANVYGITISDEVKEFTLNVLGTRFIPWKNLEHLQVDNTRFQAPSFAPLEIMYPKLSADAQLWLINNLSLNSTIESDKFLPKFDINPDDEFSLKQSHTSILVLVIAGIVVTALITLAIFLVLKFGLKYNLPWRNLPTEELEAPNPGEAVVEQEAIALSR